MPVVGFVSVYVIDLSALFTAARHKRAGNENVCAHIPNTFDVVQFNVGVTMRIYASTEESPPSSVEDAPVRVDEIVWKIRDRFKLLL